MMVVDTVSAVVDVEKPKHREHLVFLDGLRGVAAFSVGWLHTSQIFSLGFRPTHAFLAVDFFFCLSGFVIAYAYDERFDGGMRIRDFALRRVIRLYPMILCGIVIGTAVSLFGTLNRIEVIEIAVASLMLLPLGLFFHKEAYPINNPIWSLFFELLANAIYAIERTAFRLRKSASLLLVLGAAIMLVLMARHEHSLEAIGFIDKQSFFGGFVRVSFPFLAGIMIHRYWSFKLRFRVPSLIIAASLFIILVAPIFPASWIYESIAVIIIFPAIVIFGTNTTHSTRSAQIWNILGKLSYPFYIIHQPIIRAAAHLKKLVHLPGLIDYMLPLLSLSLALGCAFGIMTLYDEPVRRWLSSKRVHAGPEPRRLVA